jgi:hypothetical protein
MSGDGRTLDARREIVRTLTTVTVAPEGGGPARAFPDLVGSPDPDVGPVGQRAAAALRRLARREDLKAAVLGSPAAYAALRRPAARFVAGETRHEALTTAATLAAEGHRVTVDHMGEDTRDAGAARAAADEFLSLLAAIGPAGTDHVPAGRPSRSTSRTSASRPRVTDPSWRPVTSPRSLPRPGRPDAMS